MDLRTIQDWIVKRRLSGINGVVEINSWGGYLKQYEIAIDPSRLKGVNITLLDVFNAIRQTTVFPEELILKRPIKVIL